MGVDASKGGGTSPPSAAEPLTLTLNDKGAFTPLMAASKGVGSAPEGAPGAPPPPLVEAIDASAGRTAGAPAETAAGVDPGMGAAVGAAVTGIAKA